MNNTDRPQPPDAVADEALLPEYELFVPDGDLAAWVRNTFILDGATLYNPDHAHLEDALIGFLWTNAPQVKRGRRILGTAEIPGNQSTWSQARWRATLRHWFTRVPDFVITLYAPYEAATTDAQFCALLEHELYHCRQQVNEFGEPLFSRATNSPLWAMRGHDVEEFIGVVRRYGAVTGELATLVDAASQLPAIDSAELTTACGACAR